MRTCSVSLRHRNPIICSLDRFDNFEHGLQYFPQVSQKVEITLQITLPKVKFDQLHSKILFNWPKFALGSLKL